jgi:hypothetical protein
MRHMKMVVGFCRLGTETPAGGPELRRCQGRELGPFPRYQEDGWRPWWAAGLPNFGPKFGLGLEEIGGEVGVIAID